VLHIYAKLPHHALGAAAGRLGRLLARIRHEPPAALLLLLIGNERH
jgi:hypothetical protein